MRLLKMLVSISAAVLVVSVSTSFAVAASDTVAKVGSVPVTSYELQREIQKKLPAEASFHAGIKAEKVAEIRKDALDRLVERAYKVQYALTNELSVPASELDSTMQSFLGKFANPEQLAGALGGESLDAYRASTYRQLLAEKAEQVAIESKIGVSEKEVKDYYAANSKRYFRPLQFKASHILIQVDPASNEEGIAKRKERAEKLLKRAKAGEDFYNLAYYESDDRSRYVGGSLGYFHEGQTVAEFDQAVKQLKPGEVSGLVRTRWGFHIVRLDERNDARQLEFSEVKTQIEAQLKKDKRDALYKAWIDGLRQKFPVQMAQ